MIKDSEAMGNVYQFIVLGAIIGLNILTFVKSGQLNEILVGGLLGVMIGIPVTNKK